MILGVSGSPRNRATEYVLRQALNQLNLAGYETTFWGGRGKTFGFCNHCDYCLKGEGCVIDDDIQELYTLLEQADAYVFATPVYNGSVSGQLKAVMDRTRALFASNSKVLRYKPGFAIAVGGDRAGGQEHAIQQLLNYYTMSGAVPVSGGFFGANLGASFWSKDTLKGVKEDEEGFRTLDKSLKRLIKYMEKEK
jgi:multimeric flavodoxin WrbA